VVNVNRRITMKTEEEIKEKIKNLREKVKSLGQYRVSCANLGRGVTDSILQDMKNVENEIRTLQNLLED